MIQFPSYYKKEPKKEYNYYDFTMEDLFQNIGIAVFTYNCLTNFFSVASAIKDPNIRRLRKVFIRSFIFLFILMCIVGIIGYLSIGKSDSPFVDLIIYRPSIGNHDYFMQIARIFLIIALFVNGVLNTYPLKQMVVTKLNYTDLSLKQNILVSFLLMIFPTIIASIFTSIQNYVSITGCFTGSLLVFFFPSLLAIKIRYFKSVFFQSLLYIYSLIIFIMICLCTYYTAIKFYSNQ